MKKNILDDEQDCLLQGFVCYLRTSQWVILQQDKVDMEDIGKPGDLISIGTHLTRTEADSIKSSLTATNIHYVVNGHHATSRYHSLYYEIKVERKDRRTASLILGRMRAKTFIENRKCPKCKTLGYREIEKRFWERVSYFGTTLVQCQKCKTKYPI